MRLNRGFLRFISSLLVMLMVWGCASSNLNTPNLSSPVNNTSNFNIKNYPCNNVYANSSVLYTATYTHPYPFDNSGLEFTRNVINDHAHFITLYLSENTENTEITYHLTMGWGDGGIMVSGGKSGIVTVTTASGIENKRILREGDTFTVDLTSAENGIKSGSLQFTMGQTHIKVVGSYIIVFRYDLSKEVKYENFNADIPLDTSCPTPTPTPTATPVQTPRPTIAPTAVPCKVGNCPTPVPTPLPTPVPTPIGTPEPSSELLSPEEVEEVLNLLSDADYISDTVEDFNADMAEDGIKIASKIRALEKFMETLRKLYNTYLRNPTAKNAEAIRKEAKKLKKVERKVLKEPNKLNHLKDRLNDKTLDAARRELAGELKIKGKDHVIKVQEAQQGLINRIDELKKILNNTSTLDPALKAKLSTELSEASKLLDKSKLYVPLN